MFFPDRLYLFVLEDVGMLVFLFLICVLVGSLAYAKVVKPLICLFGLGWIINQ